MVNGRLVGVLSRKDLLFQIAGRGSLKTVESGAARSTRYVENTRRLQKIEAEVVNTAMTPYPRARPSATMQEAAALMLRRNLNRSRHAPRTNCLIGIVSRRTSSASPSRTAAPVKRGGGGGGVGYDRCWQKGRVPGHLIFWLYNFMVSEGEGTRVGRPHDEENPGSFAFALLNPYQNPDDPQVYGTLGLGNRIDMGGMGGGIRELGGMLTLLLWV